MNSIYVDFHNTTTQGEARLNTIGSIKDLNKGGIVLTDGLLVRLYCEDFEVIGSIRFSEVEHAWVAAFNNDELRPIIYEM